LHQPPAHFASATSRFPAGLVPALNFPSFPTSSTIRHQHQPLSFNSSPLEHLYLPSKFYSHKYLGISFNNLLKDGFSSPDPFGVQRSGQSSLSNLRRSYKSPKPTGIGSLSNYSQAKQEASTFASPLESYFISGNQASSHRTEAISGSLSPHHSLPTINNEYYSNFNMSDSDTLAAVQASAQDVAQNALATTADLAPQQMDSPEQMDSSQFEPFSPRRGHTHKRNEEPPKNDQGKMVCKFQKTQCPQAIFDRKCEWRYVIQPYRFDFVTDSYSKHMDKHERPYKCEETGCEKLQGFTYSGGLLRHQREVHKMHGGTKESLHCPYENCKRNSGSGFTRKENLSEHVRRVHRRDTDGSEIPGQPKRTYDSMDTTDPALEELSIRADIVGDENIDPNVLGSQPSNSPTKRRRLTQNGIPPPELGPEVDTEATMKRLLDQNKWLMEQNTSIRKDLQAVQERLNKVESQYARRLLED
jgi:hypothetical protein